MKQIRTEIDKRLETIEFNKLYKGFRRYDYALYDAEKVYLKDRTLEKDNRFLGNSAIVFEGEYIAIWFVTEKDIKDLDILTCNIIHEMFHAHQWSKKDVRDINDIKGTQYPIAIEHHTLKQLEIEKLIHASTSEQMLIDLKEALSYRKRRVKLNDMISYELNVETMEGYAEYMMIKSLRQLNPKKYDQRLNYISQNLADEHLQFDSRRIAYFTGAMLCYLSESLGLSIQYEMGSQKTIFDLISGQISIDEHIGALDLSNTDQINEYIDRKNNQLKIFKENDLSTIEGSFRICGYDPMNMIGFDHQILHKHFVMLMKGEEQIFVEGPVLTTSKKESLFEVLEYTTKKTI